MRILAVDDEPIFLDFLTDALAQCGYTKVVTALNGKRALRKINRSVNLFDCFLIDIRMDAMDGITLCHLIRQIPEYSKTPIVMLTALTEKNFIDAAFRAGANDYVTKPIDHLEIKARMGMIKDMLAERTQVELLSDHIAQSENARNVGWSFEDAITLNEASFMMPYLSLENYLLKLGNMRLRSHAAIGFVVENAEAIYRNTNPQNFIDCMVDVGISISEILKSESHMLSYAGGGNFVAVVPHSMKLDPRVIGDRLTRTVEMFAELYSKTGQELPSIHTGVPARNALLSSEEPTRILEKALENARATVSCHPITYPFKENLPALE